MVNEIVNVTFVSRLIFYVYTVVTDFSLLRDVNTKLCW